MTVTAALLGGLALFSVGVVAPASAASRWEDFHSSESFTEHNACDVSGFTVKFHETSDGRFRYAAHGPDRLPYRMSHSTIVQVATNPANGKSMTEVQSRNGHYLHVTDNGDGTFTVITNIVFSAVLYAESGETIGHYTGQIQIELLIDNGGTPTDPYDDQIISGTPIKDVTHGDDFCTTLIDAIG